MVLKEKKMKSPRILVTFALACIAFSPSSSSAVVLVSNLNEPLRDTTVMDQSIWACQGFKTDAHPYFLVDIRTIVGEATKLETVSAQLRISDANGDIDPSPAGLLADFNVPDLTGALSARAFSPQSLVVLEPNTTYYFMLGVDAAGSFGWSYANTNNTTGSGTLGNYEYSLDQGATWANFGNDFPYYMEVNVSQQPVTIAPTSFAVFRGTRESGGLSSLATSDDNYMVIRNGVTALRSESPITLRVAAASPGESPTELKFAVENRVSISGLTQRIDLYNYTLGRYDLLDQRTASQTDTVVTVTTATPVDYVENGTRKIQSQLRIRADGPVFTNTWRAFVDETTWEITP